MKKLTQGKERDVISIFGMPGLGKTTLARKVYINPYIVNVKEWCAVSQAYNRRMLLAEIFKQATNDDSEIKEDDDIADMLRRVVIGKRYLIVLDDIWDVKAWEDLEKCFFSRELEIIGEEGISKRELSPGSTGSRVTSRHTLQRIASCGCPGCWNYCKNGKEGVLVT
ncbi:hypothetical protein MTR67_028251 [Solanum verrucosum]|uniref:NB-ARC domain-containing protein n=1 Tax=Solanum verrucosum TaxID=315347 RepID=A0AAF0TW78_SOLVR|nr:hypothetical protein MTR67_028251 [Solanum verrucosum]